MADREIDINSPDLDTGRRRVWTARPSIAVTPQQASAAKLVETMDVLMRGLMLKYLVEAAVADSKSALLDNEATLGAAFNHSLPALPPPEMIENERRIQRELVARYGTDRAASDVVRHRCFGTDRPLINQLHSIADGYANAISTQLLTKVEEFYTWHESHQPILNPSEEGKQRIQALRAAIDGAKAAGLFTAKSQAVG